MRGKWLLPLAIVANTCPPALAVDTIYLRDGRILRCQIVAQAPATLTYERWGFRYTLEKQAVEWLPTPPAALVALGGLMLPGAGHLLLGEGERFFQTLGLTALLGGGTYYVTYNWITRYDRTASTAAGAGVALLPWLTAAVQATATAWVLGAHPPLKVERDEAGYRREVGMLVAP